jgi:hypothetical protein
VGIASEVGDQDGEERKGHEQARDEGLAVEGGAAFLRGRE